jgi:hypothetical protein
MGLDYAIDYFDAYGEPAPDNQGVYGLRIEYNDQKLPIRIMSVGSDGQPIRPKGTNFTTSIVQWNDLGQQISIEMVDQSPGFLNAQGNANQVLNFYDEFGNLSKMVNKQNDLERKPDRIRDDNS